jgi:hypothetical protein
MVSIIAEKLGDEVDADRLWENVKTNLQAGKVRLLFVADLIPAEVKRIVEFLNRQMDPAEVLAIELRQFEGEGLRTIVPSVYGQTEESQQRKGVGGPKRRWDESSVVQELSRRLDPSQMKSAQEIISWIKAQADEVVYGRGTRDGSIGARFRRGDAGLLAFQLWTTGAVGLNFGYMNKPPFNNLETRQGWVTRLNAVPGIALPADVEDRFPNIRISAISSHIDEFLAAMDWLAKRLRYQEMPPTSSAASC